MQNINFKFDHIMRKITNYTLSFIPTKKTPWIVQVIRFVIFLQLVYVEFKLACCDSDISHNYLCYRISIIFHTHIHYMQRMSMYMHTMVVNSGLLPVLIRNNCWHRRKRKRRDKTSLLWVTNGLTMTLSLCNMETWLYEGKKKERIVI
mgnify:CR=1 FL=1